MSERSERIHEFSDPRIMRLVDLTTGENFA